MHETQSFTVPQFPKIGLTHKNSPQWSRQLSQHALLRVSEARLTGALSIGGMMRGVTTNVYLWKTSEKPKETGQKENSKFGSCIYV